MERETFPGLLAAGAKVLGVVEQSYWLDLGTPEAFVQGSADLVLGVSTPPRSPPRPSRTAESLVLAGAASETTRRPTPAARRLRRVIESGAHMSASVLETGAVIGPGAKVTCSIIGAGARIGANTVLDNVVIGDGAVLGADNELRAGARVWCGAVLPDKAVRFSSDE